MRPLYIFDLDGTLALIEHRKHIIEEPGKDDSKWRRFYAACDKDSPNTAVIMTLEILRQSGAEIWIFSGRSDEVREITVEWLTTYTFFTRDELKTALVMRVAGDRTSDHSLKRDWYQNRMSLYDRVRLVAVFEDRARVVAMWRSEGVACFQVAPGEF